MADTIPPLKEKGKVLEDDIEACEAFDERAGILEHEGGMTREEAEARAREMLDHDHE